MIPMGIILSATTVVGNSIGANDVIKAKKFAKLIVVFNFIVFCTLILFYNIFKYSIVKVYT